MASLLLFTDVVELHLRCGVPDTGFLIHETAFRSFGGFPSTNHRLIHWSDARSFALMADLDARLLQSLPAPDDRPQRRLAERQFDIDGHRLRFRIQADLGRGMSNEIALSLLGPNPWASAAMSFSKVNFERWADEREALRSALLEAAQIGADASTGSPAGLAQRI